MGGRCQDTVGGKKQKQRQLRQKDLGGGIDRRRRKRRRKNWDTKMQHSAHRNDPSFACLPSFGRRRDSARRDDAFWKGKLGGGGIEGTVPEKRKPLWSGALSLFSSGLL